MKQFFLTLLVSTSLYATIKEDIEKLKNKLDKDRGC